MLARGFSWNPWLQPLKRLFRNNPKILKFHGEHETCFGFELPLHVSRQYSDAFAEFAEELTFAAGTRACAVTVTVLVTDKGLASWFDRPLDRRWHSIAMTLRGGQLLFAAVIFCSRGQGGLDTVFVSDVVQRPTRVAQFDDALRLALEPIVSINLPGPTQRYLGANAMPLLAPGVLWSVSRSGGAMWMRASVLPAQLHINRAVLPRGTKWWLGGPDRFDALDTCGLDLRKWRQEADYRLALAARRLVAFCLATADAQSSVFVALWIFEHVAPFWLLSERQRLAQLERVMASIRRVRAARVKPAPAAPFDK
jgi:hypothetical protein